MAGGKERRRLQDVMHKGKTGIKRVAVLLLSMTLFASTMVPGVLAEETDDPKATETTTAEDKGPKATEEKTTAAEEMEAEAKEAEGQKTSGEKEAKAEASPKASDEKEGKAEADPKASEAKEDKKEADLKDSLVSTRHEVKIKGKTIPYTATAGTMVIECDGEKAEVFFVAYTMDDVEDISERPVTFAFNGGPGGSSSCIQLGCLGPRRVVLDEKGSPVSLPAKVSDNENSILDMTDLVFIDPVGTGYSRPVDEDALSSFIGYENDLKSVGEFIRLYITRYDRWGSEKYLAGESYGTTRAVGLCDYLVTTYALDVNGLILISSANDFPAFMEAEGNDLPYVTSLPTLAADAWYHKMVSKQYQDMELEEYLEEVREFASKDYLCGLFMGDRMSKQERDKLAEQVSGYIGLPKGYILKHNLRVSVDNFRRELLSDKDLEIGRFDGRMTGPLKTDGKRDDDPSFSEVSIALGNAMNDYVTRELKYKTDVPYILMSQEVDDAWTYPDGKDFISQEDVIQDCMARNRFLRIWVLCGYYDGATPFYSAEWVYSHVFLNDEGKDNLQFTYYPSGHMIYLEKESFDKFRKDAEDWFAADQDKATEKTEEDSEAADQEKVTETSGEDAVTADREKATETSREDADASKQEKVTEASEEDTDNTDAVDQKKVTETSEEGAGTNKQEKATETSAEGTEAAGQKKSAETTREDAGSSKQEKTTETTKEDADTSEQ